MTFLTAFPALVAALAVAPPSATDAATVRVASYNTWLLPLASDERERRREAMPAAVDALAPDVLCLQEVWSDADADALGAALSKRLPARARGGGGLAVLSRWPIREERFERFPSHPSLSLVERLGGKGFLAVVIDTPSGPLRVVDSHLALDHDAGRPAQGAQLDALVAALRETPDLPTVLCADLNMRAVEAGRPTPGFTALSAAGYRDAAGTAAGPGGAWATRAGTRVGWPRAGRTARWDPDYLMVRDGARAALRVESFQQALDAEASALSDHNLQLAVLRLTSAAP